MFFLILQLGLQQTRNGGFVVSPGTHVKILLDDLHQDGFQVAMNWL